MQSKNQNGYFHPSEIIPIRNTSNPIAIPHTQVYIPKELLYTEEVYILKKYIYPRTVCSC